MPNATLRRALAAASFTAALAAALVVAPESARAVLSSGSTDMFVRGTTQQRLMQIPSDTTDPALRFERDALVDVLAILDEAAVNAGLLDDLADLKRIAALFQSKKARKLIPDAPFISALAGLVGNLRSAQEIRLAELEMRLETEEHPKKVRKSAGALLATARSALAGAATSGLNSKGALSRISKAVKALDAAEELLGEPQITCEPSIAGMAVGTGSDGMSSTDDWQVPSELQTIGSSDVSGVLQGGPNPRLDITATFGTGARFTLTLAVVDTVALQPNAQIGLTENPSDLVQVSLADADAMTPNTWSSMNGTLSVVEYDATARVLVCTLTGSITGGRDDPSTMDADESTLFLSNVTISVCDWTDAPL